MAQTETTTRCVSPEQAAGLRGLLEAAVYLSRPELAGLCRRLRLYVETTRRRAPDKPGSGPTPGADEEESLQ